MPLACPFDLLPFPSPPLHLSDDLASIFVGETEDIWQVCPVSHPSNLQSHLLMFSSSFWFQWKNSSFTFQRSAPPPEIRCSCWRSTMFLPYPEPAVLGPRRVHLWDLKLHHLVPSPAAYSSSRVTLVSMHPLVSQILCLSRFLAPSFFPISPSPPDPSSHYWVWTARPSPAAPITLSYLPLMNSTVHLYS